jgi:hypothetical protein
MKLIPSIIHTLKGLNYCLTFFTSVLNFRDCFKHHLLSTINVRLFFFFGQSFFFHYKEGSDYFHSSLMLVVLLLSLKLTSTWLLLREDTSNKPLRTVCTHNSSEALRLVYQYLLSSYIIVLVNFLKSLALRCLIFDTL